MISEISGLVPWSHSSLLRSVEGLMLSNAQILSSRGGGEAGVQSVQGEAMRWACRLKRNVT